MTFGDPDDAPIPFDCQTCGACCSYSASWPRFSLESESRIAALPEQLVAPDESGMRCTGNRCNALTGTVGEATSCSVYDARPDVCRACQPGDADCLMARARFGLPVAPATRPN